MTQPELEGWLKQADLIERGRTAPVIIPWIAPNKSPAPSASGGNTQTFISKRKTK